MKRTAKTILVLCAVVALSVSACKKDDDNATTPPWSPVSVAAATYVSSVSSFHSTAFSTTTLTYGPAEWSSIGADGAVSDGTVHWTTTGGTPTQNSDAYDGYGTLWISNGVSSNTFSSIHNSVSWEDSSLELVFPEREMDGVTVERKLYANPTPTIAGRDLFIRWLDILTNNSAVPVTLYVDFYGDMGSDSNTNIVADTDGDLVPTPGLDNWLVSADQDVAAVTVFGDPIVGHLVDGSTAYDFADTYSGLTTASTFSFYWDNITLQPGETKILMHLSLLTVDSRVDPASPGLAGMVTSMGEFQSAPGKAIARMDADEINAVINMPAARNNCNIRGVAGTMIERTLVTAVNVTRGTNAQSYSLGDGSFGICLSAVSGDQIWVSDGTRQYSVFTP